MTIGILLITHPGIGTALLANTSAMLERCPLPIRCIEVPPRPDLEALERQAHEDARAIDDGDGVLILTDAYGSTPSNLAQRIAGSRPAKVVSGVNLPMLIRVFNYCGDTLDDLAQKAYEGGVRGIHLTHGEGSAP